MGGPSRHISLPTATAELPLGLDTKTYIFFFFGRMKKKQVNVKIGKEKPDGDKKKQINLRRTPQTLKLLPALWGGGTEAGGALAFAILDKAPVSFHLELCSVCLLRFLRALNSVTP